jgi:hypothetical protein
MNWSVISGVFFLATFKFMFAPFTGAKLGLTLYETFFSVLCGGILSSAIFYFASEFFLIRAHNKRIEKRLKMEQNGLKYIEPKKFKPFNKFIIRLKHMFGIYGITFWAPFFLSVPLGTIIVAKFYGKLKKTYPLVLLGMLINSILTTSLAYLIF